jgi:hypothetical protein
MITESNSYEEFKEKYEYVRMKKLQNEHELLIKDIAKLNSQQNKINDDLNKQKELNDSLLNSSSWKLTKPLRKLMN